MPPFYPGRSGGTGSLSLHSVTPAPATESGLESVTLCIWHDPPVCLYVSCGPAVGLADGRCVGGDAAGLLIMSAAHPVPAAVCSPFPTSCVSWVPNELFFCSPEQMWFCFTRSTCTSRASPSFPLLGCLPAVQSWLYLLLPALPALPTGRVCPGGVAGSGFSKAAHWTAQTH